MNLPLYKQPQMDGRDGFAVCHTLLRGFCAAVCTSGPPNQVRVYRARSRRVDEVALTADADHKQTLAIYLAAHRRLFESEGQRNFWLTRRIEREIARTGKQTG